MHAPTIKKWHRKKKNKKKKKKVTLHILTHGHNARVWADTWMVCINDKSCDIRERNVTTRSEI